MSNTIKELNERINRRVIEVEQNHEKIKRIIKRMENDIQDLRNRGIL